MWGENSPIRSAIHPFLVTAAFGLPVCRLGLASYGQTAIHPEDVLSAVDLALAVLGTDYIDVLAFVKKAQSRVFHVLTNEVRWLRDSKKVLSKAAL